MLLFVASILSTPSRPLSCSFGGASVPCRPAQFGPQEASVGARLIVADPPTACSAASGPRYKGKVVLVTRGSCAFDAKARFMEQAGASAVLIANNVKDRMMTLIGSQQISIPVAAILYEDGEQLQVQAKKSASKFVMQWDATWLQRETEDRLQAAMRQDPTNLNTRLQLATMMSNQGRHTKALEIYRESHAALPLGEREHGAFRNAVFSRSNYPTADVTASLSVIHQMQQQRPNDPHTCWILSKLLLDRQIKCASDDTVLRRSLEFCLLDIGGPFLLIEPDVITDCSRQLVLHALEKTMFSLTMSENLRGRLIWHVATPKKRDVAVTIEHMLTAIRREMVLNSGHDVALEFVSGLAIFCHRNDFLFSESATETDAITELVKAAPTAYRIAQVACYRRLYEIDGVKTFANEVYSSRCSKDSMFCQMLRVHVLHTTWEIDAAREMSVGVELADVVSKKVQRMYEQSPYPSWQMPALLRWVVSLPRKHALQLQFPHLNLDSMTEPLNILHPGSGTGQFTIDNALQHPNESFIAFDISRRSIAYSIRKAKEWLVHDAITFYYGDILNLGRGEQGFSRISMNETGSIKGSRSVMEPAMFDLIETTGVLHHMADPETGLKSVTKVLKPGGILKLGLYSCPAREWLGIHYIREIITASADFQSLKHSDEHAEKVVRTFRDRVLRAIALQHKMSRQLNNTKPSEEELRSLGDAATEPERQAIQDVANKTLMAAFDRLCGAGDFFFSLSSLRDLLFHIQEACYTIPQIEAMLTRQGLRFVGFVGSAEPPKHLVDNAGNRHDLDTDTNTADYIRSKFIRKFGVENLFSVEAWDQFEAENPSTFQDMYIFYAQKIESTCRA